MSALITFCHVDNVEVLSARKCFLCHGAPKNTNKNVRKTSSDTERERNRKSSTDFSVFSARIWLRIMLRLTTSSNMLTVAALSLQLGLNCRRGGACGGLSRNRNRKNARR